MFNQVISFLAVISIPVASALYLYVLIVGDQVGKGFLIISAAVSAVYGLYLWIGSGT